MHLQRDGGHGGLIGAVLIPGVTHFPLFEHEPTHICDAAERLLARAVLTASRLVLTWRSWTLTAAASWAEPVVCCARSAVAVEASEASTSVMRPSIVPVMLLTVALSVVDCSAAAAAAAACMTCICVATPAVTPSRVASAASSRTCTWMYQRACYNYKQGHRTLY